MDDFEKKDNDAVYSSVVKAGRRTYFFDVKATRQNEYYVTITESKKIFEDNGNAHFEKHKIFLYKEDFEKFADGFNEVLQYVKTNNGDAKPQTDNRFTDIDFDDLEK